MKTISSVVLSMGCSPLIVKISHCGRGRGRSIPRNVVVLSPLSRAVLTYGPGDTVEIAGGKAVILNLR